MRILAIESSSLAGTVSLLEDGIVLDQINLNPHQRSAQSLAKGIRAQLESTQWSVRDVDLVTVAQGPGSFTGLRVGVTTAKVLAYVTNANLIGVNTLEVIAAQAPRSIRRVEAVLDAHRNQLFAATFQRQDDGELTTLKATEIVGLAHWLDHLDPTSTVTGPGLKKVEQQIGPQIRVLDRALWTPQATSVGRLGYREFQSGRRDNLWEFVPQYYRPSAAEERLAKREGAERG